MRSLPPARETAHTLAPASTSRPSASSASVRVSENERVCGDAVAPATKLLVLRISLAVATMCLG